MALRRLFRRPKAEVTHLKGPQAITWIDTSPNQFRPDSRVSAPEKNSDVAGSCYVDSDESDANNRDDGNEKDGDSDESEADSLDSFIAQYYGAFGRSMVEDAARSPNTRGRVRHVLQQRPGLPFERDAVQHAARLWDGDMMTFLLETQGKKVHLTCRVVGAAVTNEEYGVEIMGIFQERGAAIKITEQVAFAAYQNDKCGRDILMQLLGDPKVSVGTGGLEMIVRFFDMELVRVSLGRPGIQITKRTLVAAAQNPAGRQILEVLLMHRADVQSLKSIAEAAAGNQDAGWEVLKFIIETGRKIPATENVWQAAAVDKRDGRKIIGLLLNYHGKVLSSEEVMVVAIENSGTGDLIIELLLEHASQFVLTDTMILALVRSRPDPVELLDVFLDRSENEIQFTQRVTPSFNQTLDDETPWSRQRRFGMADALSYILCGKHKNRVSFTVEGLVNIMGVASYEVICEILDTLGERISITEVMIEAVAETNPAAHLIVQRFFDYTPSVQVTDRAVILAVQRNSEASILLRAFFKHSKEFLVPPEAIEAATCSYLWDHEIVETLLEQTPTVKITEKAVAASEYYILNIFISKCRGEIRLILQPQPDTLRGYPVTLKEYDVKRILLETQGACVLGPPIDEVVRIYDPEILALVLKKTPKSRWLPSTVLEDAVRNELAGKEIIQMLIDHGFEIN